MEKRITLLGYKKKSFSPRREHGFSEFQRSKFVLNCLLLIFESRRQYRGSFRFSAFWRLRKSKFFRVLEQDFPAGLVGMRGIFLKFSRVWFCERCLFSGCARTMGPSKVAFSWFYEITFIRRREGLKSDMDSLWRLVRSCPDAYFRVEKL